MGKETVVYDKAKYHDDTIEALGLPERQSSVHTAFFLGWLVESRLYSDFFKTESKKEIEKYLDKSIDAVDLYELWDHCLIEDMLNEEGNKFAQAYFDFDKGEYIKDYVKNMQGDLPSEFHVEYTWENQGKMNKIITARYNEWKIKSKKKWWNPF